MRRLARLLPALLLLVPAAAEAKGFVAVSTRQPARIAQWYIQVFGLHIVRTERPDNANLTVTVLDGDLATVEILGRSDLPPPSAAAQRQGYFKVGFEVPDLEARLARWRADGIEIAAGPFDDAGTASRSVILRDPDGNAVHVFASLPR